LINEKVAREFQQRYLNGERGATAGLYAECRHITERLAKSYASRHDCENSGLDDTIQIILSRVLARYRNPSYFIHSFAKVLNIEVVHELSNHKGPKAQFLRSIIPLESIAEPESKEESKEETETRRDYFNDILASHQGARILFALAIARSYRSAIGSIDTFGVGRPWIYDNCRKLYYIWKTLNAQKRIHDKSMSRNSRGDPPPDRGHKPVPKQGKQAYHEQGSG
jgi:hypothetical protein